MVTRSQNLPMIKSSDSWSSLSSNSSTLAETTIHKLSWCFHYYLDVLYSFWIHVNSVFPLEWFRLGCCYYYFIAITRKCPQKVHRLTFDTKMTWNSTLGYPRLFLVYEVKKYSWADFEPWWPSPSLFRKTHIFQLKGKWKENESCDFFA